MPKIIILKGLPASSKSTWSKEQVAKDPNTKRVSKDDLRLMLDNSRHSKANEKFVLKVRDFTIMEAINDGHNIIVDDTNLHPKHEERIRELAKTAKLKTTVEINDSFLEVPLEECIKRDLKRPNSVGEKVIRDTHKQAFPDLYKELCCPIVQDKNLPKACIFDIDGSLSKMGDRSPYDWKKVGIDTLNEPVFQLYKMYKENGYKIIICSGRDSICEEETKEWLEKYNIIYDALCMRLQGNTEKDSVVKEKILEKLVELYCIEAVIDDRKQVVDMWRSKGLPCFQVAEGDF